MAYYFRSEDIKVFPCQNRGIYTLPSETISGLCDPEARMLSEYNLTHTSVSGSMKSYAIKTDNVANLSKIANGEETFKFVISGYYFELKILNPDIYKDAHGNSILETMLKSNFRIALSDVNLPEYAGQSTEAARKSHRLANYSDNNISSLDDNGYFYGLALSNGTEAYHESIQFFNVQGEFDYTKLLPVNISHGDTVGAIKIGAIDSLITGKTNQTVIGEYNNENDKAVFIVGNGTGIECTTTNNETAKHRNNSIEISSSTINSEINTKLQISNTENIIQGATNAIKGNITTIEPIQANVSSSINLKTSDNNKIEVKKTVNSSTNATTETIEATGTILAHGNLSLDTAKYLKVDVLKDNKNISYLQTIKNSIENDGDAVCLGANGTTVIAAGKAGINYFTGLLADTDPDKSNLYGSDANVNTGDLFLTADGGIYLYAGWQYNTDKSAQVRKTPEVVRITNSHNTEMTEYSPIVDIKGNLRFNYNGDDVKGKDIKNHYLSYVFTEKQTAIDEQILMQVSGSTDNATLSYSSNTSDAGLLKLIMGDDANSTFELWGSDIVGSDYNKHKLFSASYGDSCSFWRGLKVYKTDGETALISATDAGVVLATNATVGNYPIATIGNDTQTGTMYASAFYAMSDARLKENIEDTKFDAENILDQIKIRDFTWKTDEQHKQQVGVIAQELAEVMPEEIKDCFVHTTGETFSISESKLVYLLIKAYQEEKAKRIEIENRLNKLEGIK